MKAYTLDRQILLNKSISLLFFFSLPSYGASKRKDDLLGALILWPNSSHYISLEPNRTHFIYGILALQQQNVLSPFSASIDTYFTYTYKLISIIEFPLKEAHSLIMLQCYSIYNFYVCFMKIEATIKFSEKGDA